MIHRMIALVLLALTLSLTTGCYFRAPEPGLTPQQVKEEKARTADLWTAAMVGALIGFAIGNITGAAVERDQ